MRRLLWGFSKIIAITILLIGLRLDGYLPEWLASSFLTVFILLTALRTAVGVVSRGSIAYYLLHIPCQIFTIGSFSLLGSWIIIKAGGLEKGISILLKAFFDTGLEWIIVEVSKAQGYYATLLTVLGVVLFILYLRRYTLGVSVTRVFLRASLIALLIIFIWTIANGNLREMGGILGYLPALLIVFAGIVLMLSPLFHCRRQR